MTWGLYRRAGVQPAEPEASVLLTTQLNKASSHDNLINSPVSLFWTFVKSKEVRNE